MDAVGVPARKVGVEWTGAANAELCALSQGYPYFIQEFASAAWLTRRGDTITKTDVAGIAPGVHTLLDESLYRRGFQQISPREAVYILALHGLGPGVHHGEEIARALGVRSSELGSVRSQLIKKDILFAPARSLTESRLPLTEAYIDRHLEEITQRARFHTNPIEPN
jgi:hypothetical protein